MELVGIAFHQIYTIAGLHGTGANLPWTYFFLYLIRENNIMALKIGSKDSRKINVVAEEPLDFAGVAKHTFDVDFKILPKADLDGIRETMNSGDDDLAVELIFDSIIDVKGVKDDAGAEVPFNTDLLTVLRETAWVRSAILQAFWAVQGGITQPALYKALKSKN